jgi:Family of unknown function (DUF6152)
MSNTRLPLKLLSPDGWGVEPSPPHPLAIELDTNEVAGVKSEENLGPARHSIPRNTILVNPFTGGDVSMRPRLPSMLTAILTVLVAAFPAFAHHGFQAEFDKTKCMDLRGNLSGLDWENPHAYFHIDVKDASGKSVSWSLEMITPNALTRNGSTRQDFLTNMGKPMVARACPAKAGGTAYRGTAEFLQLSDGLLRVVGQNVENLTPEQLHW